MVIEKDEASVFTRRLDGGKDEFVFPKSIQGSSSSEYVSYRHFPKGGGSFTRPKNRDMTIRLRQVSMPS